MLLEGSSAWQNLLLNSSGSSGLKTCTHSSCAEFLHSGSYQNTLKQECLYTDPFSGLGPFSLFFLKAWRRPGRERWSSQKKILLLLLPLLLDKTQPAQALLIMSHPLASYQPSNHNGDGLACKWKSFNNTEKNNESHCFQIIYTDIEAFFFFFYQLNSQEICESCLSGQRLLRYPLNHSSLLD